MIDLKHHILGVAIFALSLLLAIGTALLFPTCGPGENGAWMRCHWSGRAIIGTGALLVVLSAACLLVSQPLARIGLRLAEIPASLLVLAIPNGLIGLCGSAAMQCRAVTLPAVTILSIAVAFLSIANVLGILREVRNKEAGSI